MIETKNLLGNDFEIKNYPNGGLSDYQIKVISLLFKNNWLEEINEYLNPNDFNHYALKNIVGTTKDLFKLFGTPPTLDIVKQHIIDKEGDELGIYEESFENIANVEINEKEEEAIKMNFRYYSAFYLILRIWNKSNDWVRDYRLATVSSLKSVLKDIYELNTDIVEVLKRFNLNSEPNRNYEDEDF